MFKFARIALAVSLLFAWAGIAGAGERITLGGEVTFELVDPMITRAQLERTYGWLDRITPLLKDLHAPAHFSVHATREAEGDLVPSLAETIRYGIHDESAPADGSPDPVFAHEYGHLVFSEPENLARVLPPALALAAERAEARRLSARIDELNSLMMVDSGYDLSAVVAAECDPDHSRLGPYARELETAERRLDALREKVMATRLDELAAPYDEFFADLLAVFVARDGRAMNHSVGDPSRDFTAAGTARGTNPVGGDPHQYFLAVRQLLWSRWVAAGRTPAAAQHLLRVTYEAIGAELTRRAAEPPGSSDDKPEIEAGLRRALIARLK